MSKNRLILALVIVIALAGGIYSWLNGDSGSDITTGIHVFTSPSDTSVKVNGNAVKLAKNSRLKLSEGEYTVSGERTDFNTMKQKIKVSKGKVTNVTLSLTPANEKGQALLQTEKEQRIREELAYTRSITISEEVAEKTPITKFLPAITADFRIDYGVSKINPDDPTQVAIFITTDNTPQQQAARDWIKKKGYDPEKLEIYYRFYEN